VLFIKVYKKSCDVVGVVKAGIAIFPGYVDHKTRIYKNIRLKPKTRCMNFEKSVKFVA